MLDYFQKKIKNKKTIIPFIIVILILFLLIFNVNLSELVQNIKKINFSYLIIGLVVFYLSFIPRTWRYQILLKNVGIRQRFKEIAEIYFLSWFANLIVPAKLGDLYRSYLIKKNYGHQKSETLGLTFVERFMDLIFLIILISITGFLIIDKSISGNVKNTIFIAYAIIIVIMLLFFLLKRFRAYFTRLLPKRFKHVIPTFEKGASTCLRKKNIITIILLTIFYWSLEIGTLYFVAISLGVNLSAMLIIFATLVSALTSIIPITPSGAGAAEAGVTGVLVLASIPYSLAFTIAIIFRFVNYWSGMIIGTIVYIKSKLK